MTNGLLDGLNGIDDARTVQVRDNTNLEKLMELSKLLTVSPPDGLKDIDVFNDGTVGKNNVTNYSTAMLSALAGELNETFLTEQDIKDVVIATSNIELHSDDHKAALGIYSGCLLTLLAERNKKEGKETKFHINGQGNRFDYLFLGARGLDEIIVQRFSGDYILNIISVARRMIGIGIKGDSPLSNYQVRNKNTSQIVGIGIMGSRIFGYTSYVDQVVGLGLSGTSAFPGIGFNGKVKELLAIGVYDEGTETLANLGAEQTTILGMNMGNLFDHGCGFKEGVKKFICLEDVPPSIARRVYSIVYGGDGREYTKHSDYLEPEQLATQFDGKTHYEITAIVDKISKLSGLIQRRLS